MRWTVLAVMVVVWGGGWAGAGEEREAARGVWPGIGCWFWGAEEFRPDGYKRFIDLYARHSGVGLLTTSIRHPVEVTEAKVHDQIGRAARYARERGLGMVMDLDVRLARQAFFERYPEEMQEIVRVREFGVRGGGEVVGAVEAVNLGDHYTFAARGYESIGGRVLRVYSYRTGPDGVVAGSVRDVTERCRVIEASGRGVKVAVGPGAEEAGRTVCVMAAFTLFTPDVFAPHLVEFERGILRRYADVALAGACKDEWGFPGRFRPRTDDIYYSRWMGEAYGKRRPGRDLVRDLLLMARGEEGRGAERAAAVNHYMEMNWQRNAEIENRFYAGVKEVFGAEAMVGTHPTWYAYPTPEEAFKNGLDWWACRRDLAQTDESTPFAVRTALAKKWGSPLWYNMYYDGSIRSYEEDLWRHLLGGGRMNLHPLWPHPVEGLTTSLLRGGLMEAECRVRLLNYIATAPIDCPAAVVFGHPAALNWTSDGFADAGLAVSNGLWAEGFYADLIPSSEIAAGHLKYGADGWLEYGPQRYRVAVVYHPEYERRDVAAFWEKGAAEGKTALLRVGQWTADFEGKRMGKDPLPGVKAVDAAGAVRQALAALREAKVEPQTPSSMRSVGGYPASMMPKGSGMCRLLDGTVVVASGEKDVLGDPIQRTLRVGGREVRVDAVGLAAVRLDGAGRVEALAAGGLKSFRGGGLAIELSERVDVALWRDGRGAMRGVVQGWTGPIPEGLLAVTADWRRIKAPERWR